MTALTNTRCIFAKLRIGATEATAKYFFSLGLDAPTTSQFVSYAEIVDQSEGGRARHGFARLEMTWVNVRPRTVWQLRNFVDTALTGTRSLFMTVPMNDGAKPGLRYIDITGTPWPLEITEIPTMGHYGMAYDNVTLTLNNVAIINNPSTID